MISSNSVKRFWICVAFMVATCVGAGFSVDRPNGEDISVSKWMGMPAVCMSADEPCWLQLGVGEGVVVMGGGGVGVILIGAYGVGILFAIGQLAGGLIAVCQVGVGLVFFLGQLAFGLTGLGQVAIGGLVQGQGKLGRDGTEFLEQLNEEVNAALGWRLLRVGDTDD